MRNFGYFTVDAFDCPPFQMFSNGDCQDPWATVFEPHSMKLWCKFARVASSILDVGANVGIYSLAAAALRKDIAIHAFEPNPYAAARLRVNKHVNKFANIMEHLVAVSNVDGQSEFSVVTKPGGQINSGGVIGRHSNETMPIYVRRLDLFPIDYGPLPLIKIDVEGHERHVLEGMKNLAARRPIVILESFTQENCDVYTEAFSGSHFFSIDESGCLEPRERLIAATIGSDSLNHLILPALGLL